MKFENEVIKYLEPVKDEPWVIGGDLVITNCVIGKLMLAGGSCKGHVTIVDCVIDELVAVGYWFEGGLLLSGCVITNANIEASGHNVPEKSVVIENNIFKNFLCMLDAYYIGPFIFRNNILLDGCDLYTHNGTSIEIKSDTAMTVENNLGDLYA